MTAKTELHQLHMPVKQQITPMIPMVSLFRQMMTPMLMTAEAILQAKQNRAQLPLSPIQTVVGKTSIC